MRDFHREIFFLDFHQSFSLRNLRQNFFHFCFWGCEDDHPLQARRKCCPHSQPWIETVDRLHTPFLLFRFFTWFGLAKMATMAIQPVHDRTIICIDPESLHKISVHSGERFTCDKCPSTFSAVGSLWTHNKVKHENRRFSCFFLCPYHAITKIQLEGHMERKHPEKYRGQTYKCTICNYETNLKFQLKKHMTAHKSCNESHICKICKKNN